jgi:hypothetical protein
MTKPTPPEAPEAVIVVCATGSSDGSRDHVTATSAAEKEARPRAAGDHNRTWHNEPGDAPGFQAPGWRRPCGLATER